MNTFSEELRKSRELQNISLMDISKRTRISIKYLEALERGNFEVLPQTYIRAFIKSYAESIGLPANEMLKKYEITVVQKFARNSTISVAEQITDASLSGHATTFSEEELKRQTISRKIIVSFLGLLATVLVVYFIFDYFDYTQSQSVEETPFQEVVREQEQLNPAVTSDDTSQTTAPIAAAVALPESLVLRGVANDSTYIIVRQDSRAARRGYALNGSRRVWRAKDSITLSLSDAGSIRLSLNGIDIGYLGAKGTRIRNFVFTKDSLAQRLQ